MNKLISLTIILITILFIFACNKDDDDSIDFGYHAHIHSPSTDDKHVQDTIQILVDFESHTGETIHHVNVRIYNKADNTEVYNKPTTAHVHASDGTYAFTDELVLSNENGVSAHTDWILEASVWGEENREGEVMESVEFHVHPE